MNEPLLPGVAEKFIRYVRIDTQSDPDSKSVPSTEKQKDLARLLVDELLAIGIHDAEMDEFGYVFGTIPGTTATEGLPTLALLAHMDTAPDESGTDVKPIVHFGYDGGVVVLPGDAAVTLDPARQPALLAHIGEDLITSDGTTLLGSDDKAGVALIVQLAEDLLADQEPRPTIRICFTIDEEIGRGVEHLDLKRLGADVAYTIDGSDVDTVSFETFNAAAVTVTVQGIGVHPGYAKGVMVNALRVLTDLISALPPAESPEHTSDREGYFHPHTIRAGDAARASAELILRDFTWEGLERRKQMIAGIADTLRLKYPGVRIELKTVDQYRNMRSYIEEKDSRAVSFAIAAGRDMGITLESELVRGGTDGARLSEMGLPTPNLFNGGMDYHSRFEWNTVQNLERSLEYLKYLVRYWAEHGNEAGGRHEAAEQGQ